MDVDDRLRCTVSVAPTPGTDDAAHVVALSIPFALAFTRAFATAHPVVRRRRVSGT